MKGLTYGLVASVVAAASVGLATVGCSSSNGGSSGDGGINACPANPPTVGTACFVSSETSCSYNTGATPNCVCCGGGGPTYECQNGKWTELAFAGGAAGAPAAPPCPVTAPENGSACSLDYGGCAPPQQTCSYACGETGSQIATCNGATWTVTGTSDCNDGGTDGGDASDDAGDGGDGG